MGYGQRVRRSGDNYSRLVLPGWVDPLDTSYAKPRGGRWNPPREFGALYLSLGLRMARLQVLHKLAGQPYGPEDLDPDEQHDLIKVHVDDMDPLDRVTDRGLEAVGLPRTYPKTPAGDEVPHTDCQAIARQAYGEGQPGVACRSAALNTGTDDEELAVFETHTDQVAERDRLPFDAWFWDAPVAATP